jgi:hypothetical protein
MCELAANGVDVIVQIGTMVRKVGTIQVRIFGFDEPTAAEVFGFQTNQ